ncbi:MAG: hypothetical protein OEV42_13660 [Deltaproteobacteria bacterium]|nr:hypothetical protein [Deltaproteobacteria bacterium]
MKMTTKQFMAFITLLISFPCFKVYAIGGGEAINQKVTYYKNGKAIMLFDANDKDREKNLILACEEFLVTGNDRLKLFVTNELLKRSRELGALEISYGTPKKIKIYNKSISVKKLFLPLKGKFSAYPAIFYETFPSKERGVIVNIKGKDIFKKIVEQLKNSGQ